MFTADVVSVISGEFLFPREEFSPDFQDTGSPAFKLMASQIENKVSSHLPH